MSDTSPSTSLSAVDLLRQFVELRDYSPDLESWSDESFAANPPRLYRLGRLRALFAAYQIDWDPAGFAKGAFIESADERYADVARQMEVLLVTVALEPGSLSASGATQRQLCFEMLLRYRERVEKVLVFPDRILAASGWFALASHQMQELNRVIDEHLLLVEEILAALLSPEGRRFELLEMVRDYGYPDVDLEEIDIDWI